MMPMSADPKHGRRHSILVRVLPSLASAFVVAATVACADDVSFVEDRQHETRSGGAGTSSSGTTVVFTQAEYEAAIQFDLAGEHGKFQGDPSLPSAGYPCGVPDTYSWKRAGDGPRTDVPGFFAGLPVREAGSAYDQVYNACRGPRPAVPNARIELTNVVVDFYSGSQQRWIRILEEPIGATAFAEDFLNNEATFADVRSESGARSSVRCGMDNAEPRTPGTPGGPVTDRRTSFPDGPVGYNLFGSTHRFAIAWSDVEAIVVAQAMRCIPEAGTDLTDCNRFGYIANMGLNNWATLTSPYDGFQTHGGVSASRFKVITTDWQIFAVYAGPTNFAGLTPPEVPRF